MSADERREKEASLDLTPMIDVTFLLLVFFMVATKFRVREANLRTFLPLDQGPDAVAADRDTRDLRLVLDWNGDLCALKLNQKVYATVDTWDGPSPDFDQLSSDLGLCAPEVERITIDAAPQVPFKFVVRSVNSCKAAGIENVTFARAPKPF